MKIHEECGVFGVMAKEPSDVARMCYYGLYALQHRGQESCGFPRETVWSIKKPWANDPRGLLL